MEEADFKNLAIYQKAQEIAHLTQALVDAMDQGQEAGDVSQQMLEDAYTLAPKIAGAESIAYYQGKMEKAVQVKIAACSLQASTALCRMEEMADDQYIQVVRDEIENFRHLFLDWIDTFQEAEDLEDEWGLFRKA